MRTLFDTFRCHVYLRFRTQFHPHSFRIFRPKKWFQKGLDPWWFPSYWDHDPCRHFNIPRLQGGVLIKSCQGIITCLERQDWLLHFQGHNIADSMTVGCNTDSLTDSLPWLWIVNPSQSKKIPFQNLPNLPSTCRFPWFPMISHDFPWFPMEKKPFVSTCFNPPNLHRHSAAEDHTGDPRTLHAELHQPKTSWRPSG